MPSSRAGTVTITAHLPKEVRDRLKILAVRLDRTMNELMGEALDDLFAKQVKKQMTEGQLSTVGRLATSRCQSAIGNPYANC